MYNNAKEPQMHPTDVQPSLSQLLDELNLGLNNYENSIFLTRNQLLMLRGTQYETVDAPQTNKKVETATDMLLSLVARLNMLNNMQSETLNHLSQIL